MPSRRKIFRTFGPHVNAGAEARERRALFIQIDGKAGFLQQPGGGGAPSPAPTTAMRGCLLIMFPLSVGFFQRRPNAWLDDRFIVYALDNAKLQKC